MGSKQSGEYGDITVQSVVERYVVTDAPERAQVSLALLAQAQKGLRIDGDEVWIGYPVEEEVGYRITGLSEDRTCLEVEKL